MLKTAEEHRLKGIMQQFGCTPREAKIYLHALSIGATSIQNLARNLRENRVTVYSAVEKLIEKGFMFESRKGKKRLVAAEDPTIFKKQLQKQQNEIDIMTPAVDWATKMLANIQKTDQSMPTVKFYEGVAGLKNMLEETLTAKNEVLVFTFVDIFSKLLTPRYLENYYSRRAKKGIRTRLIFPSGEFGKKVNQKANSFNMKIRFLPPEAFWKSGIFAWNNTVAIQSFTEGKITCTVIENDDIAFFYRNIIFELCWSQAKPIEK